MIDLSALKKIIGNTRPGKRRGRGFSSGKGGHTVGYGTKGQKAREGRKPGIYFEGGQSSLYRRMPYLVGFKNPNKYDILEISLSKLAKLANGKDVMTPEYIKEKTKLKFDFAKVMGNGSCDTKLNVQGLWFTKKAKEKIEKAGGKVE